MTNQLIVGTASAGRFYRRSTVQKLLVECLREGASAFDTAPLYGSGAMEAFLGSALKSGEAGPEVTVNTKFGLNPAVCFAYPERFYFLGKFAQAAGRQFGIRGKAPLSHKTVCESAMASLERSIRHFGEGRIDVFFAHEVPVAVLMTPAFLEFIRQAKSQGLFRRFGLGGYRSHYPGSASQEFLNEVDVIQVDSVPGARPSVPKDWPGEIFLHGVLAPTRHASGNTRPAISLEDCFEEALNVQGARRLVIGISRSTNFRRAAGAIQTIGAISKPVNDHFPPTS